MTCRFTTQDEAAATALAEASAKAIQTDEVPNRFHPAEISQDSYLLFLDRLETLTPAERRVFNMYVQNKKAQEIADELLELNKFLDSLD